MSGDLILPSVFLSHGTPMLALAPADDPYCAAVRGFFAGLPRPKAIVIVSAHRLSPPGIVEINASRSCELIYDFRGFPKELYQVQYPCPGSPETAVKVASLLADHGFQTELIEQPIDHGVWAPLKVAYPAADIPVVQISMPYPTEPQWVLKMGKALAPLREQDILLIGSGGAVHNLQKLLWHEKCGEGEPWARAFEDWMKEQLRKKDVEALLSFETLAPNASLAHPTTEHFFPAFFTIGAAWLGDRAVPIFEGVQYGTLSMFSFALTS